MKLGLADRYNITATLEVEAMVISDSGETQPLAGQTFYILDRSASDGCATDALGSEEIKFFITDSQGKARIEGLKAETYYIGGVSETNQEISFWNVRIELKPGKNSLILDNRNMAGEQSFNDKNSKL